MGTPAGPAATARFFVVGAAVALANAGLLVLQLAAGRWLAPFVGSSLETWTAVIGAFLAGIAAGNAVGGRWADRHPSAKRLAAALALGAIAAGWMILFPRILAATGVHRLLPLGVCIPVLAALLCLPAGFALGLPTPLAVRLAVADVRRTGRAAGAVFALGTLGCLAGNYLTGFVLIPNLTLDAIGGAVALGLLVVAGGLWPLGGGAVPPPPLSGAGERTRPARLPIGKACLVVFLCSFAAMALELTAARLLAQVLGVSLFTWTGVIGVMLAGTAAGNWLGGGIADRAGRAADPGAGGRALAWCLALAAVAGVGVLVAFFVANARPLHDSDTLLAFLLHRADVLPRVLAWTFGLYFPAMLMLGTISPQAIRLAVPDVAHAGRVAGRVYAWSTAGAIAGTFATGFVLVSSIGAYRTVLLAALLPAAAALLAVRSAVTGGVLYATSLAAGVAFAGVIAFDPELAGIARETNYFTIRVTTRAFPRGEWELAPMAAAGPVAAVYPPGAVYALQLDRLTHSRVKLDDPGYLFYRHEAVQLEHLSAAAARRPDGVRALVIGGGGYTFPRAARTRVPTAAVDVVEIDPGVTAVAYAKLGLDPALGIASHHMDGRQFVADLAEPGRYDLVTLDAVNDLTVPYHLLTKEFHNDVRRTLKPDGVYLLTVIDILDGGRLWAAAVRTLGQTFPHVRVLTTTPDPDLRARNVVVIYASDVPFDPAAFRAEQVRLGVANPVTFALPLDEQPKLLESARPVLLTDQFAPVDNLMAEVFRRRGSAAE